MQGEIKREEERAPAHQNARSYPAVQSGVPKKSWGAWERLGLVAAGHPSRRLEAGHSMASPRAVPLSLRKPTHAVCVVGVETVVDVYR